jgi:DNA-binding Lrp family transcriptional regulator
MAPEIEALDQRLLNAAQTAFPLCAQPWAALGEGLGLSETDVIRRLQALKQRRILRQVSAIFDSKALGYRGALVAARAEPARLEACAAVVSAHPGVSHNYQRENEFNLWFTLAAAPGTDLDAEADRLGAAAGLSRWKVLPALRTFRIGVSFDLESGQARALAPQSGVRPGAPAPLTEADKAAVRVLQVDLPLTARPFDAAAAALGWDLEQLFDWMAEAGRRGWLRRFAAVLRHREAGFGEGGMGVWCVPEARVAEVGAAFAADPAVTHCYERPRFEGWPYNVFTMVHGTDREDCLRVLGALGRRVEGWTESAVLFSVREFKKERGRYFLEAPAVAGAQRLS